MPISKRATIKQVAQAAGVSTQTVSRVLNDRPDVAPETRQRVQQVIASLSYQPSALARSLIQQRSDMLGVVTAGLKYIGPSRTLNGITSQAELLGYSVLLKELPSFHTDDVQPLLQSLLSRHVDGIIWAVPQIGDNHQWLQERLPGIQVPVVFLTMPAQPGLVVVDYDNFWGGRVATEHLLEQGYHNIGHIGGPSSWWESGQRKSGWQAALQAAGLPAPDAYCAEGNWSSASGETAFRQLLTSYPQIEAVFSANDQMALGVLQVAHQLGLAVPERLGVVGFDGLAEAAYYWPPLTTVIQDQYKLGCTAVETIVQAIEAARESELPAQGSSQILKPELLVRQSSLRQGRVSIV